MPSKSATTLVASGVWTKAYRWIQAMDEAVDDGSTVHLQSTIGQLHRELSDLKDRVHTLENKTERDMN